MRKILVVAFLLLSFISYGQKLKYSIEFSYNLPYIANVDKTVYATPQVVVMGDYISPEIGSVIESFSSHSGGIVSGNVTYSLTPRFIIVSGLQLNLVRYKRKTEIKSNNISATINPRIGSAYEDYIRMNTGNENLNWNQEYTYEISSIPDSDKLGNTSSLYVDIPISLGIKSRNNEVILNLGLITSFLMYSQVYKLNYTNQYSYFLREVEKDKTSDDFSNLLWNGTVEMVFIGKKNIDFSIGYIRSLNSIYDTKASVGKPKFNIFSVGLAYKFSNK